MPALHLLHLLLLQLLKLLLLEQSAVGIGAGPRRLVHDVVDPALLLCLLVTLMHHFLLVPALVQLGKPLFLLSHLPLTGLLFVVPLAAVLPNLLRVLSLVLLVRVLSPAPRHFWFLPPVRINLGVNEQLDLLQVIVVGTRGVEVGL